MLNEKEVNEVLENIDAVIGDVPVSVQLSAALCRMATKEHTHSEYVPRSEFDELRSMVELLIALVGDVPVSEQINSAIK